MDEQAERKETKRRERVQNVGNVAIFEHTLCHASFIHMRIELKGTKRKKKNNNEQHRAKLFVQLLNDYIYTYETVATIL